MAGELVSARWRLVSEFSMTGWNVLMMQNFEMFDMNSSPDCN